MPNTPEPLPAKVVAQLLHKLGNDDAFRELFQSNPVEALRQVGAPNPEGCALCMKVPKLAEKHAIIAANEALKNQLTGNLNQQIPLLIAR